MARFFKFGSFSTDTVADIVSLWADVNVSGRNSTLRLTTSGGAYPITTGTGQGYQVPSGKTLYITQIMIGGTGATVNFTSFDFLYGDTDVGFHSASLPTNAKSVVGAAAAGGARSFTGQYFAGATSGPLNPMNPITCWLPFPALKYPTVQLANSGTGFVYCDGFLA